MINEWTDEFGVEHRVYTPEGSSAVYASAIYREFEGRGWKEWGWETIVFNRGKTVAKFDGDKISCFDGLNSEQLIKKATRLYSEGG